MTTSHSNLAGRPRQERVTQALLHAALLEMAEKGPLECTVASIAKRAKAGKQALYRRWPDKTALLAASLAQALAAATPPPPQRGAVARDLKAFLLNLFSAHENTALGNAHEALLPFATHADIAPLFARFDEALRLHLRQIFIATAFERDMDLRIDLLLGFFHYRRRAAFYATPRPLGDAEIDRTIHLVLGLTAPRAPEHKAS